MKKNKEFLKENKFHWDWDKIRIYDEQAEIDKISVDDRANHVGMDVGNYRKKLSIIRKTEVKVMKDNWADKDIQRVAKSRLGLKKERRIVNIERAILNKDIRESTFIKMVVDEIKPRELKQLKPTSEKVLSNENPILILADIHYKDDKVSKRIQGWGNEVIRELNNPKTITIINAGDSIEGELHKSSQLERTLTPMQQIANFACIITEQVQLIHSKFPNAKITYYETQDDNHGEMRILGSKAGEDQENTTTSVTYEFMKRSFRNNDKVDIKFQHQFKDIEINGELFHILHGQDLKSSDSSRNVAIFFAKRQRQFNMKFRYVVIGHFHQFKIIEEKGYPMTMIFAPSLKDEKRLDPFEYKNNLRSTTGWLKLDFDEDKNMIIKRIQ